jgi:hypothetical protein
MRTQLLCALAILCGAEVAHAQGWGTNAYNNYYMYPASYQAPGGYDYSGAYGSAGYYPSAYGYNYSNGYPYYTSGYYGYPEYTSAEVATTAAAATPVAGVPADGVTTDAVLHDGAPLVPDVEPTSQCRFYLAGDYMMSWFKQFHLNFPLVTTGSPSNPNAGALGEADTAVLVGGDINESMFNGFKIEAGFFLDDHRHWSIDTVVEYFGQKSVLFNFQSDATGSPVIARPIIDVTPAMLNVFPDTGPGSATGGATVDIRTELYSTELNATCHAYQCGHCEWDLLGGFRYVHLQESLNVVDRVNPLPGGAILPFGGNIAAIMFPDSLVDVDSFRTNNNFYGLQLGTKFRWDCDWVYLSAFGKIALGANSQVVDINGLSTFVSTTMGNTTLPGGILALPSNSGHHTQTVFSIVPEGGISIGLKLTKNIEIMAGYSFLFWTQVARPGNQIDPGVNGTQVPSSQFFGSTSLPGPIRPIFTFRDETLWVQSLTFGMQFQY